MWQLQDSIWLIRLKIYRRFRNVDESSTAASAGPSSRPSLAVADESLRGCDVDETPVRPAARSIWPVSRSVRDCDRRYLAAVGSAVAVSRILRMSDTWRATFKNKFNPQLPYSGKVGFTRLATAAVIQRPLNNRNCIFFTKKKMRKVIVESNISILQTRFVLSYYSSCGLNQCKISDKSFLTYSESSYRLLLVLSRFIFSLFLSIVVREEISLGIRNRASGEYAEISHQI